MQEPAKDILRQFMTNQNAIISGSAYWPLAPVVSFLKDKYGRKLYSFSVR
jgi:hypothetical protein